MLVSSYKSTQRCSHEHHNLRIIAVKTLKFVVHPALTKFFCALRTISALTKLNSNFLDKTLPIRIQQSESTQHKYVLQAGEISVMAEQEVLCINGSNCKVMINWVPLSGGHRPISLRGRSVEDKLHD